MEKAKINEKSYKKLLDYVYPQLKKNPFYGKNIKKLVAWSPETWRYRTGNFRLFYEIDQSKKIINLISYEDRKDSY